MTTGRQAWARLASFFRKEDLDREFDEELSARIELATQDHMRQGMSLPEARRLALIRLGGMEPSRELHRESRGLPWLDDIVQDIRYAARGMLRSRGFTVTAIATLAIGIGINATVFTVTNAVLLKGFPLVPRNDRLLYISNGGCCISYPDFEDIRAQAKSFAGMGITHGIGKIVSDESGFPESIDVTEVSADTFKTVGQRPIMGQDFAPSDEVDGATPVAILSYAFWEHRYGKDRNIVGRTVRMNGAPTTIIGVMGEGFSFPQKVDMWVPLVKTAIVKDRDHTDTWFAFGRLAEGVTFESARAEVEGIIQRLESTYPLTDHRVHLVVQHFHEFFIGPNAAVLYGSMWGAVSFVLLIACANLANFLLARAMGRSREISVRMALGAGRWRIVRQLLVESVMLSGVGGFLGWWIAKWSVHAYQLAMAAKSSWLILDYSMDHRVMGYLIAISGGTGILFGLAPALRLSRLDVNAALKDGGRGATGGGRGKHLSAVLVSGEMALAVVLLAGAGVMIRSFLKIHGADMGVHTAGVLAASMDLPPSRYPSAEQKISFYDGLTTRLEAMPGVESVAMADALPSWNARRVRYELAGVPSANQNERHPKVLAMKISPAYFRTLGARMLSGRDFFDADVAKRVSVAIVNLSFASRYWPGEDPLGKRLRLLNDQTPGPWLEVVGVATNIVQNDMNRQKFEPLVYLPYRQQAGGGMWIFLRTRVPPGSLATTLRREVQRLDPDLPLYGPFALADRLERFWDTRFYGALFLIFAGVALLLASIGLYSVIAHSVSQRTQEIGIRMAVGATASDILQIVFREGIRPLGMGLSIGLAASLAVNRILKAELIEVSPSDPATLVVASAVLIAAAMLGCLIPARRAMRVDPIVALRYE
jgi:putative ABC transport system permease protein